MYDPSRISVNRNAMHLVHHVLARPTELGVVVTTLANGATVIDMGQSAPGGWVAGRYYALITMGGLAEFSYETFPAPIAGARLPAVRVMMDQPALASHGAQIAGWRLQAGDLAPILSGPARSLNANPDHFFDHLSYRDSHHQAVISIQTSQAVRLEWAESIAAACAVRPQDLFILAAPTSSLVCAIQVAARSVEQAMHRLEEEGLPLDDILSAQGLCVIPPLVADELLAMGRINDALLYGSEATVYLRHEDDAFVAALAERVISAASPAYGRPFVEIMEDAGRDFYSIPQNLHSPAVIHLNNALSGCTHSAGAINTELLARSFFGA